MMLLTACGGGGGGDGTAAYSLPAVPGYGIVTHVEPMHLNGDDLLDLVVVRTGDDPFYSGLFLQALVNEGGSFSDATETHLSGIGTHWRWIDRLYRTDLDGDGREDLVGHISSMGEALPPLLRQPDGSFAASADPVFGNNMAGMVPLDVDADGDIDLLLHEVVNWGNETEQQTVWRLLANRRIETGTASFEAVGQVAAGEKGIDTAAFVSAPAVIDVNSDNYPDVVYGGPKWKNGGWVDEAVPLSVLLNGGDGTFTESALTVFDGTVPAYPHLRLMEVADFDGNGADDVLIGDHGYDLAPFPGAPNAILRNSGNGKLTEYKGDASTLDYKGFTHAMAVGDIEGDGDPDVVFADVMGEDVAPGGEIRILANAGDGTFSRKSFRKPDSIKGNVWTAAALADLNGDGAPDLVLGALNSSNKSFVLWNDGQGNFD